ncbi:putative receptor protein kinase ZmPK1 isoform X1 [Lolium rigidum]|uniref:putative receptor protein kinase ZmPK1 isoform X1 n=1 Tax=Lolium rigidum TaxID=89674 RepID=UPI001F5E0187|nr:putative receptor protein kinase ZmPK1 isoform X1 [Lolium rigidum]
MEAHTFDHTTPSTPRKMGTFFFLIILALITIPPCSYASAQSTLSTGSSFSVEDYRQTFLTSPNADFSCGFYEVGRNGFSFSIWFTNTIEKTLVWSANPKSPVNGRGSMVLLNHNGNLVLTDVNGTVTWDSNTSSGEGTMVSLLDTGNLIVKDSTGKILWESFSSPTDTLLPLQPLKKEISSIYWPSADYTVFENGRTNYNSSRIAVLDTEGFFLSSDGVNVKASDWGTGVKRRLTIGHDGNIRIYSLNASTGSWIVSWEAIAEICSVHGICGQNRFCEYLPSLRCSCPPGYEMTDPQNWNRGCRPQFNKSCSRTEQFDFIKVPQSDCYGFDLTYNQSVSLAQCKKICLDICTCSAFTYKIGSALCYTKSVLFNCYRSANFPGDNYIKVPKNLGTSKQSGLTCNLGNPVVIQDSASMYGMNYSNKSYTTYYVFATILAALVLLFIGTSWSFLYSKQNIPKSMEAGYRTVMSQFRMFTYRELREATGKFKEEIGRGASGIVYRGVLEDKRVIAVKKLTNISHSEEEFWAEMNIIGRINHMNLVRMWGFCSEGQHKLLVYEYVENESLDKFIFGDVSTERLLSWSQRFKIALGTARGLAYLHHECLEWIIHCDVKPENILLSRDFEAKIADFGLAKLSKRDSSSFSLAYMRGTMGYMAPEWALNLPINAKVDVYSYGVVLLELVTGSRISSGIAMDGEEVELSRFVHTLKDLLVSGDVKDIVDTRLNGYFDPDQVAVMVKLALSCLEERNRRPTMNEIVRALLACDDHDNHPAYSWLTCDNLLDLDL